MTPRPEKHEQVTLHALLRPRYSQARTFHPRPAWEGCKPGPGGSVVYLNVDGDLDQVLARIPAAGGKVIQGRLDISPHGFVGMFEDLDGNVVGLHSNS